MRDNFLPSSRPIYLQFVPIKLLEPNYGNLWTTHSVPLISRVKKIYLDSSRLSLNVITHTGAV